MKHTNKRKSERNSKIVKLHKSGNSYFDISLHLFQEGYGRISPQRVGIILHQELARGNQ